VLAGETAKDHAIVKQLLNKAKHLLIFYFSYLGLEKVSCYDIVKYSVTNNFTKSIQHE
jgi:hypothetical protein